MGASRVKCFWMVWLSLAVEPTWPQRPMEHCFAMWLIIWQIDLGDSYFCHTNVLNVCFNQKLRIIGINVYMYVDKKSWRSDVTFSMLALIGVPHCTHVSVANCQILSAHFLVSSSSTRQLVSVYQSLPSSVKCMTYRTIGTTVVKKVIK